MRIMLFLGSGVSLPAGLPSTRQITKSIVAKEFRPLNLGVMRLEKGRGLLTLRALKVAGKRVMDVRRVTLTLQDKK